MRWLFSSALVLAWSAAAAAKSFTGNRLLVVLEEQSDKEKYSVFLEDLTCKLNPLNPKLPVRSQGRSAIMEAS